MLPKLRQLIVLHRNQDRLTKDQCLFLWCWLKFNGDKLFGFRGGLKFEDQFNEAVKYLQETEREWQDRIKDNRTSLNFIEFFTYFSITDRIELVNDFNNLMKGMNDEYNGFEDVGRRTIQEGQSAVDELGGQGEQSSKD